MEQLTWCQASILANYALYRVINMYM